MKRAIVSGAAGFAGCNLTERLIEDGYTVYALVRAGSRHNERLSGYSADALKLIEADMGDYDFLPDKIHDNCDIFFHLAWTGGRDDFEAQRRNIDASLKALEAAVKIGCKRFVASGSQAEYGVKSGLITEDLMGNPFSAYGASKLSACYLTRFRASQLGIEWVWGRIFSLIGKYEPEGRLMPDIIRKLKNHETPHISAASQNWDYLDAKDAAEAIIALGEHGKSGEIYNIANGDYHPLKFFMEEVRAIYAPDIRIEYGEPPVPYVSLMPSVEKIHCDTGWKAKIGFAETVRENYWDVTV